MRITHEEWSLEGEKLESNAFDSCITQDGIPCVSVSFTHMYDNEYVSGGWRPKLIVSVSIVKGLDKRKEKSVVEL